MPGKSADSMAQIGIVISNHNGWRDTLACLESLRRQTVQNFETLLLDDASTDDSVEQLLQNTPEGTVSCPKMLFMEPADEI